jgi:hypothetical protein
VTRRPGTDSRPPWTVRPPSPVGRGAARGADERGVPDRARGEREAPPRQAAVSVLLCGTRRVRSAGNVPRTRDDGSTAGGRARPSRVEVGDDRPEPSRSVPLGRRPRALPPRVGTRSPRRGDPPPFTAGRHGETRRTPTSHPVGAAGPDTGPRARGVGFDPVRSTPRQSSPSDALPVGRTRRPWRGLRREAPAPRTDDATPPTSHTSPTSPTSPTPPTSPTSHTATVKRGESTGD